MNIRMSAAALLLLTGAACGGAEDDTFEGSMADTTVVEPGLEPGQAPGAAVGPEQVGSGQTIAFEPLQDSGVAGEATITDRGGQTEVMVRLTGAVAGGSHNGHIHSGSCDAIGGVVQALEPIEPDGTGTGTMTTTVEMPVSQLSDGQHVVVYHAEGGAPMTCAPLSGENR